MSNYNLNGKEPLSIQKSDVTNLHPQSGLLAENATTENNSYSKIITLNQIDERKNNAPETGAVDNASQKDKCLNQTAKGDKDGIVSSADGAGNIVKGDKDSIAPGTEGGEGDELKDKDINVPGSEGREGDELKDKDINVPGSEGREGDEPKDKDINVPGSEGREGDELKGLDKSVTTVIDAKADKDDNVPGSEGREGDEPKGLDKSVTTVIDAKVDKDDNVPGSEGREGDELKDKDINVPGSEGREGHEPKDKDDNVPGSEGRECDEPKGLDKSVTTVIDAKVDKDINVPGGKGQLGVTQHKRTKELLLKFSRPLLSGFQIMKESIPPNFKPEEVKKIEPKKVLVVEKVNEYYVGLTNTKNNCYINSILQVLFTCDSFRDDLIDFMEKDECSRDADDGKNLVLAIAKLMLCMKKGENAKAQDFIEEICRSFPNSESGDDVQKCFQQIVSKVNTVTRKRTKIESTSEDKAEKSFCRFKGLNNGFTFDSFYSQVAYVTQCESCDEKFGMNFQLLNVFPVPIPNIKGNVNLNDCLKIFLSKSDIEGSENEFQCCKNQKLVSISTLTHLPKYIFIYVIRGSYNPNDEKDRTSVNLDGALIVPTNNGDVPYVLKGVVEHIGNNSGGHYYAKCLNKHWMLYNDTQVEIINETKIDSNKVVGFLFYRFDDMPVQVQSKYSPLGSIFQMFLCCEELRHIINDYMKREVNPSEEENSDMSLKTILHLFRDFEERNYNSFKENMNKFENMYNEEYNGDFVQCFQYFLKTLNNIPKTDDTSVMDLFTMGTNKFTLCKTCGEQDPPEPVVLSHIPLTLKKTHFQSNKYFFLDDCVYSFFGVKESGKIIDCCSKSKITETYKISRHPKYIFISVDKSEADINFSYGENFILQRHNYYLKAIICCDNDKRYSTKCRHDKWWSFTSEGVYNISPEEKDCSNTVALLMAHGEPQYEIELKNEDASNIKEADAPGANDPEEKDCSNTVASLTAHGGPQYGMELKNEDASNIKEEVAPGPNEEKENIIATSAEGVLLSSRTIVSDSGESYIIVDHVQSPTENENIKENKDTQSAIITPGSETVQIMEDHKKLGTYLHDSGLITSSETSVGNENINNFDAEVPKKYIVAPDGDIVNSLNLDDYDRGISKECMAGETLNADCTKIKYAKGIIQNPKNESDSDCDVNGFNEKDVNAQDHALSSSKVPDNPTTPDVAQQYYKYLPHVLEALSSYNDIIQMIKERFKHDIFKDEFVEEFHNRTIMETFRELRKIPNFDEGSSIQECFERLIFTVSSEVTENRFIIKDSSDLPKSEKNFYFTCGPVTLLLISLDINYGDIQNKVDQLCISEQSSSKELENTECTDRIPTSSRVPQYIIMNILGKYTIDNENNKIFPLGTEKGIYKVIKIVVEKDEIFSVKCLHEKFEDGKGYLKGSNLVSVLMERNCD